MTIHAGRREAAINAIYAAAGSPDLWPQALDALAACFGCVGTVLMMRRRSGSMVTIVSPALAAAAAEYEAGAWQHDFTVPRAIEAALLNPTAWYSDRQLATAEEIARQSFFADFRMRHGLGPFMGGFVSPHPSVTVILTMQGPAKRRAFSDEEIEDFRSLGMHVERALTLTVRIMEAEVGQMALADALTRLAAGVFLVERTGRVTYANAAAKDLIGGPIQVRRGVLTVHGPAAIHMRNAIDGVIGTDADPAIPQPILIPSDGAHDALALYVLPIRTSSRPINDTFLDASAMVLALRYGSDSPADPVILRHLLGLTLGEARLASLIGVGHTPREAARELGITEESARTILKRVFAKTDVTRQTDLALLISRIILRQQH